MPIIILGPACLSLQHTPDKLMGGGHVESESVYRHNSSTTQTTQRGQCFAMSRRRRPVACSPLHIDDTAQQALANLLPFLLCGEESAAWGFSLLPSTFTVSEEACHTLQRIAAEELVHEQYLEGLRLALPPSTETAPLDATKAFFVSLAHDNVSDHLAKIIALDASVCVILAALLDRRSAIAADPVTHQLASRIRHDEAGHVRACREVLASLDNPRPAADSIYDLRTQLIAVLQPAAPAFEALGVDAASLFRRLAHLDPRVTT